MKNVEVRLMSGLSAIWVTFRDEIDVAAGFHGRDYRNPTVASLARLAGVINRHCRTRLDFDAYRWLILTAFRNRCAPCGDGDLPSEEPNDLWTDELGRPLSQLRD